LSQAKDAVLELAKNNEQGWLKSPDDQAMLKRIQAMAREKKFVKNCLVIGIGGSDLATRALYQALGDPNKGVKLYFAGSNTDPDELFKILKSLDLRQTLINVVSKSGNTIEPMLSFFTVLAALKRAVGKNYARHIVVTTDAKNGALRELADKYQWSALPVPANIGGRFSALTDVSLFPLALARIDIKRLLAGAKRQRDEFAKTAVSHNAPALFAALQYLAYTVHGQKIQVLMPYAHQLNQFGFWYRQLWAESLGKRVDRNNRVVKIGPTPIAALGATDQHSQIQLYNEGPHDKTVTFIEIEKFAHDLSAPDTLQEIPGLAYLAGKKFSQIIQAERLATARALNQNTRPNGTIALARVDEEHLGELIMFFELATALSGELYGINTYDQPGVEAGKHAMHDLLK
jgi:glucose-6-phosphate isomerase